MMKNEIPVLDKGYVAFLSSSLNGEELLAIEKEHFKNKINRELWDMASLTLQIRCPIFVQLYLQKFDIKVVNTVEKEVECYIPDLSEIKTGDHNTDREIAEYIKQTTESLLITSKALEKDNLDRFLSHSLVPVSVYNTIVASGSLSQWIKLLQGKSPAQIDAYRSTIYDIALTEWKELDVYIGRNAWGERKRARQSSKQTSKENTTTKSPTNVQQEEPSPKE